MRRKTYGIWVLVALGTLIMGLGNAQQLLTPQQAQDAVRSFENDSSLVFSDCLLQDITTGPTWNQTKWYRVFLNGSGDYDRIWRVQAYTGEIQRAMYGDRYPATDSDTPVGPRTQQECQVIAENYARAKYTGFDSMGFVINSQEWVRSGWRFIWVQTVQYGARTLNSVTVDVNPSDGQVQAYSGYRYAVTTPVQPQITTQQAINRAMQEAYLVSQTSLEGPTLWADPDGLSYYTMIIGGVDILGEDHVWRVCVNAVDGSLVAKEMGGGSLSRAPYVKYMKQLEAKKKALSSKDGRAKLLPKASAKPRPVTAESKRK